MRPRKASTEKLFWNKIWNNGLLGWQGNVRVLEGGREGVREKDRRGTLWVHKEEEDE